jgi:phosphohistidine phosphatase
MRLYFVRHGKAEEASGGIDDHERRLTPQGADRLQHAARVMLQLGIKPNPIYSSPRVRARQTAEIIGRVLNQPVQIREEVNFGFDLGGVAALIRDLPPDAQVMFVGHNPSISDVIRAMTGAEVDMKVGSLARVDVDRPENGLRGPLVWLLAPRVFDALAR